MKIFKIPLVALVLLGAMTCAMAEIKVEKAWVRATVPKQQSTGAFMKITSTQAVKLLSVTTVVAKTNEIHEMKMQGDIMKMRAHPDGLDIPANTTLELKSSGYHVMMMELEATIKAGDTIPIKLEFVNPNGKKEIVTVNAKTSFKNPYAP